MVHAQLRFSVIRLTRLVLTNTITLILPSSTATFVKNGTRSHSLSLTLSRSL